ncbi:MAG: prenyltransferase [Candidatus Erginobacter occultus]|nr:prenyltransferase [Candidatus Erginobacter occultus]
MTDSGKRKADGFLHRWLRVSRANFLPVSLLPFCLGAAWAFSQGYRDWLLTLLGLAGAGVVHLSANLFNEYWDYRYQADRPAGERSPHYGGSGAIQEGVVSPRRVLAAAWASLLAALAVAAGLALLENNLLILVLAAAGGAIAWGYTAPPLRLVYRGGGEAALWLAFGPLLTSGGYLLAAGSLSGAVLLLSFGPGLIMMALLTANEFGDTGDDARAGKRNLVVRVGPRRGRILFLLFLFLSYLVPSIGVIAGVFPVSSLLVILSLPPAILAASALGRGVRGEGGFAGSSRLMILTYNLYHLFLIAGITIL